MKIHLNAIRNRQSVCSLHIFFIKRICFNFIFLFVNETAHQTYTVGGHTTMITYYTFPGNKTNNVKLFFDAYAVLLLYLEESWWHPSMCTSRSLSLDGPSYNACMASSVTWNIENSFTKLLLIMKNEKVEITSLPWCMRCQGQKHSPYFQLNIEILCWWNWYTFSC